MMSHALAQLLLQYPNMPVATFANNHLYASETDAHSHGRLRVAEIDMNYADGPHPHVVIGNHIKNDFQGPNETFVRELRLSGH
jgi:hypothetical protein